MDLARGYEHDQKTQRMLSVLGRNRERIAAKEKNPGPRGRGLRTSVGSRSFWKVPGEEEEEIWGSFDPRIPGESGGGGSL
jgi:hypothetical protein